MQILLTRGRLCARLAETPADLAACLSLRALCFRGNAELPDGDAFDTACRHVMVEEGASGALLCCFRLLPFDDGSGIAQSYAAQFYDLGALESYSGRMVEMGRFCIRPGITDADVLRLAWAAMTAYVDAQGVDLLFGCSSFHGTEAAAHRDAFALLHARHIAPRRWLPRPKAAEVFRFARGLSRMRPNLKAAMKAMPPLLRTYLAMGGWVSDHAVVDKDLGTMHVFTGLEISAVPPARKRLLRAV